MGHCHMESKCDLGCLEDAIWVVQVSVVSCTWSHCFKLFDSQHTSGLPIVFDSRECFGSPNQPQHLPV